MATKKSQIFDNLETRFGSNTFRYTDIVIAALITNEWIKDPSEYKRSSHRGYYATNITGYSSDYLYTSSANDNRRLCKVDGGYQLLGIPTKTTMTTPKPTTIATPKPTKEKSFYEIYRERTIEMAKKLPALPKETSQTILWLKSAVIEKVQNIDKATSSSIYTFSKNENDPENKKFGFSEQYVNLLMEMAYNEGRDRATKELTESHNRSAAKMKDALDKIKDALDDADWIEYPECY
jgi:hypothetical protein